MDERETLSRIMGSLDDAGIDSIDDKQRELLGIFVREVILWSGRIHLVGKSNIEQTITHLLVDSWALYRWARDKRFLGSAWAGTGGAGIRVADVGSGAGFPGVIWKIADPGLDITLFERREKALRFLERAVSLLRTGGIRTEGRAAGLSHGTAPYDVVLSKASGRLPTIAPVVVSLLRGGGIYLTTKGSGWRGEAEQIESTPLRLLRTESLPAGRGTMLVFRHENDGRDE